MSPADAPLPPRLNRRDALKWIATAAAGTLLVDSRLPAAATPVATGYGTDPNLLKAYAPGEVWPLTFDEGQRATAAALCDLIIPADEEGPGAAAVRVHDFIDEWISAPYPGHSEDRRTVVEGLAWLEAESRRRFSLGFARLASAQRTAIADEICQVPSARPESRRAALFFQRYRDLTAGGYFTTPEGMKDLGYTGNYAMEKFEGPPAAVLRQLDLA